MNAPNPVAPLGRTGRIDDIQYLLELVRRTPGLPMPHTSDYRATLDYRHITDPAQARVIVAHYRAALGDAFNCDFTPRTVTAGDDTPRYVLEARLESGLTLVIVSRVSMDADQDAAAGRELTGAAA